MIYLLRSLCANLTFQHFQAKLISRPKGSKYLSPQVKNLQLPIATLGSRILSSISRLPSTLPVFLHVSFHFSHESRPLSLSFLTHSLKLGEKKHVGKGGQEGRLRCPLSFTPPLGWTFSPYFTTFSSLLRVCCFHDNFEKLHS